MKFILLLCVFICATNNAVAISVVIDPDDFFDGENLSHISNYANLLTSDGRNVYASTLLPDAANGNDTKALGRKVFGYSDGSEWFNSPCMTIIFNTKVTRFSLVIAELYFDAGPGSEPLTGYVFDTQNNFLTNLSTNDDNRIDLGQIDPDDASHGYWAYWTIQYSGESIGKIVIGGDSEPTTLDKLTFDCAELPEPNALYLLSVALLLLTFARSTRCLIVGSTKRR